MRLQTWKPQKVNWKSQGNSKNIKNKWIISFHATSNEFLKPDS